jgi:hypothetical protein
LFAIPVLEGSSVIFARRAIQRCLDELRTTLDTAAVDKLVDRLNRPGKDRLAAMWEVAILHSLAPLGVLVNESALVSGRCPDITFSDSAVSFVADITTVSDEGLDERNPYSEFSDEIEKVKNRLGLPIGGVDLRTEGWREKTARGTRTYLRLPPRKRLFEFMRQEVEPVLRQQIADGRKVLHVAFEDERAHFQITIDPARSPYSSGSFPSYDTPTIKDSNPLYNALRSKPKQLKGAGGLLGVIVGDGDTRTLADRQSHWSEVTAQEIAQEFLRQNSSIGFVLLLSVREGLVGWSNVGRSDRKLHALLVLSKTQMIPESLQTLFVRMLQNMPKPVLMPVNAALRARETQYDWGHHGGGTLSGNRIKLSAREVMEVLAGRRTVKEMNSGWEWRLSTDEERAGTMQNPFERWLMQGRLISSISVVKTDENDADDWLEIEVGDPDAAISPFR